MDAGLLALLRRLEMTEKRQAEALDHTRKQIDSIKAIAEFIPPPPKK